MITLVMNRHRQRHKFQHNTFNEAARDAVAQLNNGMGWPVKIMEGDKVLWEHDGPFGDAIKQLREMATERATALP